MGAALLARPDRSAEQLEGLRLGRRREREEGEIAGPAATRKRPRERVLAVAALGLPG